MAIPFLAVWNLASCSRHKALRMTQVDQRFVWAPSFHATGEDHFLESKKLMCLRSRKWDFCTAFFAKTRTALTNCSALASPTAHLCQSTMLFGIVGWYKVITLLSVTDVANWPAVHFALLFCLVFAWAVLVWFLFCLFAVLAFFYLSFPQWRLIGLCTGPVSVLLL